jgi:hypothetical protein
MFISAVVEVGAVDTDDARISSVSVNARAASAEPRPQVWGAGTASHVVKQAGVPLWQPQLQQQG